MKNHKDELVALMGEKKYEEEYSTLKKMIDYEAKTGKFQEKVGDVDERDKSL